MKTKFELERERVHNAHYEMFGVLPIETGITWEISSGEILKLIEGSIKKGVPYVEEEIPEGVDL